MKGLIALLLATAALGGCFAKAPKVISTECLEKGCTKIKPYDPYLVYYALPKTSITVQCRLPATDRVLPDGLTSVGTRTDHHRQ